MALCRARCRGGTSRVLPASTSILLPSRNTSSPGVRTFSRAAASSIASGSPSSRTHALASNGALAEVRVKRGLVRRARSTSSATDGLAARQERSVTSAGAGMASGGTGNSCSAESRSRSTAGGEDQQPRAGGEYLANVRGRGQQVLAIVEDNEPIVVADRRG